MSATKVPEKYRLVAPDGGWGWMILLSVAISVSTGVMFAGTFGMMYNDFLKSIEVSTTGVTMLLGINSLFFAFSSLLTNSFLQLMSQRKLAFVAAVMLNLSSVLTIFADSYATFLICQGMLPTFAFGITLTLGCSILNEYFDEKKVFVFSVFPTMTAIMAMVAPFFVEWSLNTYGYKSTQLLIGSFTMQGFISVALLQPVEWHMKRVPVSTKEIQPLLINDEKPKVVETKASIKSNVDIEKYNLEMETQNSSKIRKFLSSLIDVEFFKEFSISTACQGTSITCAVDFIYAMLLPTALFDMGCKQDLVALVLSLTAFGDLAMRITLIFASHWINKLGSAETYLIGTVLAIISRLGLLWSHSTVSMYINNFLVGVARCFFSVVNMMVIADAVPQEKFTQATGISMTVLGVQSFALGPVIGVVRDMTDSFTVVFYILTLVLALTLLYWTIEITYKKNKIKKEMRATNEKSNLSIKGM